MGSGNRDRIRQAIMNPPRLSSERQLADTERAFFNAPAALFASPRQCFQAARTAWPGLRGEGILLGIPTNRRLWKKQPRKTVNDWWQMIRSGTPEWIRTTDLLLRRQTLYPAELRAHKKTKILLNPAF